MELAEARKKAELSQAELAGILGVTAATVHNWENGNTPVPYNAVRVLSRLSGVPLEDIFCPLTSKELYFNKDI